MHIAIIGNGISGVTAARYIRKQSDHSITIISDETEHFYSRTALMYIYMGHMKFEHTKPYPDDFWAKNRIDLKFDRVTGIDTEKSTLTFRDDKSLMNFDQLILATGSKPRFYNWPGQELTGVQGLYSYQDLELLEENTRKVKKAVVVGGGLIGIELAEMLRSREIEVEMLIMEDSYWGNALPAEEGWLIHENLLQHGLHCNYGVQLKEIVDDGNGKVEAVITSNGDRIDCQFVGLTTGVQPNIDFLKGVVECEQGILVDRRFRTSADKVFAIGDCAQFRDPLPGRTEIEQVWYTGKMHGKHVAMEITGSGKDYDPGPWFNSAKFFDIEFHTYGTINSNPAEGVESFWWRDESSKRGIRINFNKVSGAFIGVNALGIRLDHRVFDDWLRTNTDVRTIVGEIGKADFDPEFTRDYAASMVKAWNSKYPEREVQMRRIKNRLKFING